LYLTFRTFLLKMCQSLIVFIYIHSALTGVQELVTRTPEHAHWFANFCWGLLIATEEKGKATEISYSDARSLVSFSRDFILWQQGTSFYVWLWHKREKKNLETKGPRTNQIASCFDALSITWNTKHLSWIKRSKKW
jgi:hypothetical protein